MGEIMPLSAITEFFKEGCAGEGIIAVTVKDRAMGQVIPQGSTVFVDTNDHRLESGALYLVQHSTFSGCTVAPTIRRAFARCPGVMLQPANDEFATEFIQHGETPEGLRLIGRVRGAMVSY